MPHMHAFLNLFFKVYQVLVCAFVSVSKKMNIKNCSLLCQWLVDDP